MAPTKVYSAVNTGFVGRQSSSVCNTSRSGKAPVPYWQNNVFWCPVDPACSFCTVEQRGRCQEPVWNWDLLVRMKPKAWAIDYLYELSDYILGFVILMD
jgi:hypothetical protein